MLQRKTAEVVVSVEPYMVMDDDMKKDASGVIALESAHVDGVEADIRVITTSTSPLPRTRRST